MTPEMITAVSSIIISVFTLAYTFVTSRKKAVLQSLTLNRMDWVKDVRILLGDFAHHYRVGDTGAMMDTEAKLELYMRRDIDDYYLLLDHMRHCIKTKFNESDYQKFLVVSTYILARPWARMSVEAKKSALSSEKAIKEAVDARTNSLLNLVHSYDKKPS